MSIIKIQAVLDAHGVPNFIAAGRIFADSMGGQATQKALDHNTPTEGGSFFWEIVSVEELKEEQ